MIDNNLDFAVASIRMNSLPMVKPVAYVMTGCSISLLNAIWKN